MKGRVYVIMRYLLAVFIILLPAQLHAECVILLHGLARTNKSMTKLEKRLREKGYHTVNFDYPSRMATIEQLAEDVIPAALDQCPRGQDISFVTHSLGGILVRQFLAHHDIDRLHRVVMLGPPNQGSEIVDTLKNLPSFHYLNGDAGMELGTDPQSIPNKLGGAHFDLGIIAGNTTINLILSMIIPGIDDGKVSVANTRLDGMHDHVEVEASHPFLMRDIKAIEHVVHYLKYGFFMRDPPAPPVKPN